jgi:hypothetical protein
MTRRKTTKEFIEEIYNIVGKEYTVLSEYKSNRTYIKMRHNECGNEYNVRPYNFIGLGNRCPECSKKIVADKQRYTQEEFEKKVYLLFQDEYSVVGKYMSSLKPIKIRHNSCGNEYYALPNNILRGATCLRCSDIKKGMLARKTHEQFLEEVAEQLDGEYEILSEYQGAFNHILIKHVTCGNEYEVTPDNLLHGRRCKCYIDSKGVVLINNILEDKKVQFEREYTFEDCRYVKKLRFDFMVINGEQPLLAIEFDGKQHFESIDFYGGIEFFNKTKERDRIKNEYCKENSLPLIRIPYTMKEEDIRQVVADKLQEIS